MIHLLLFPKDGSSSLPPLLPLPPRLFLLFLLPLLFTIVLFKQNSWEAQGPCLPSDLLGLLTPGCEASRSSEQHARICTHSHLHTLASAHTRISTASSLRFFLPLTPTNLAPDFSKKTSRALNLCLRLFSGEPRLEPGVREIHST